MLRGGGHRYGVNEAGGRFVVVPGDAVGVYMGTVPDREYGLDGDDLVITGGKLVKFARGVWSVLDETG